MTGTLIVIVGPPASGKSTLATALKAVRPDHVATVVLEDLDATPDFTVPAWVLEQLAAGRDVIATSSTVVVDDHLQAQGVRAEYVHPAQFFAAIAQLLGVSFEQADVVRSAQAEPLRRPEILGG